METIAQLSAAGQLTIPAAIRKELGIGAGDHLQLTVQDHRIVLEAVIVAPRASVAQVRRSAKKFIEANKGAIDRLAE